jgi:hypothetical protein
MFTAQVHRDEEGFRLVIPDQEAERLGLRDGDTVTADLTMIPLEVRRSLDRLLARHDGSVPDDALHAWMLSHGMTTDEGYAAAQEEMAALVPGEAQA